MTCINKIMTDYYSKYKGNPPTFTNIICAVTEIVKLTL